jgi:adenylylsulfate kinase
VWITGLPASGKSTLAAALKAQLAAHGVDEAVLESDVLRRIFTVHPRYDEAERDVFYRQIAYVGELLVEHGVPVIFDATANRRLYRDRARREIPRFIEVRRFPAGDLHGQRPERHLPPSFGGSLRPCARPAVCL